MGTLRDIGHRGKSYKLSKRRRALKRTDQDKDMRLGDHPVVSRFRGLEKEWRRLLKDPPVSYSDPNRWREAADVRPSSFPFCSRKYVMQGLGLTVPSDFDVKSCCYTEVGKSLHYVMQNAFARGGKLWGFWVCARPTCEMHINDTPVNSEPDFIPDEDTRCTACGTNYFEYAELTVEDDDIGLRGHVDGIFIFTGYSSVFEIKSSGSDKVSEIKGMSSGEVSKLFRSESPWYGYWHQASTYAALLRLKYPHLPIIRYVDFLIISRDDPGNVVAFRMEIPKDNSWWFEIKSRILTAQYALSKYVLPVGFAKNEADINILPTCQWCLHKEVCLGASNSLDIRYDALYSKRARKVLARYKHHEKEKLMGQVITGDVVDTSKVLVPDEEKKTSDKEESKDSKANDGDKKPSAD